jgi:predicted RNase H-like HicB family nuclease
MTGAHARRQVLDIPGLRIAEGAARRDTARAGQKSRRRRLGWLGGRHWPVRARSLRGTIQLGSLASASGGSMGGQAGGMRTSNVVVERDPDTGLYVGHVPGWPGAHSQGATLDELRQNLREVVEMLLEDGESKLDRQSELRSRAWSWRTASDPDEHHSQTAGQTRRRHPEASQAPRPRTEREGPRRRAPARPSQLGDMGPLLRLRWGRPAAELPPTAVIMCRCHRRVKAQDPPGPPYRDRMARRRHRPHGQSVARGGEARQGRREVAPMRPVPGPAEPGWARAQDGGRPRPGGVRGEDPVIGHQRPARRRHQRGQAFQRFQRVQ